MAHRIHTLGVLSVLVAVMAVTTVTLKYRAELVTTETDQEASQTVDQYGRGTTSSRQPSYCCKRDADEEIGSCTPIVEGSGVDCDKIFGGSSAQSNCTANCRKWPIKSSSSSKSSVSSSKPATQYCCRNGGQVCSPIKEGETCDKPFTNEYLCYVGDGKDWPGCKNMINPGDSSAGSTRN